MKANIENLKDTFKIGYEAFEDSRIEALKVIEAYHNRQYTDAQLNTLANRGQPAETFNVIKMFARMLLGYYSTVVNTVRVTAEKQDSILTSSILNDFIDYTFRDNNFDSEGDKLKLDLLLTGIMCSYTNVKDTGDKDPFGRPIYRVEVEYVPSMEIVLDPMSRKEDYNDGRFIHRFKWVSEETIVKLYGKAVLKELDEYYNHLEIKEAEFEHTYNTQFNGKYKIYNNYLLVHSIIEDDNGKTYSCEWCGDKMLKKTEITYKEVKNPYRIHKLHTSNRVEHYGLFREVAETQKAINQALIKIQLMVNTQKAFVEDNAVDNIDEFTDQFNRVNAIIPVKDLNGIKIESLSREVIDQYTIIDKALNRIQRVLSINDSFLGMAYASDSGAKVKIQQNASMVALRYVTQKVEQFYRLLGWDIVNLIKQYYTSYDVIRVADNYEGDKWVEINKPLTIPTNHVNPTTGRQEERFIFEEVLDPATKEPLEDVDGNSLMAPIPTAETDIQFSKVNVSVASVAYDDEDERNQTMLDSFLNGPSGQFLMQANPAGYLRASELAVKNVKTKYSDELANILQETSQLVSQNQAQQQQLSESAMGGTAGAMNQQQGRPANGSER